MSAKARTQERLKKLSVLIPIVMLPLGAWLGYQTFREHSLSEIWSSIFRIPTANIALAFACAAGSYLCLTFFDFLGVRYAGRSLAYRNVMLTSFVSLSIGHTVGVSVLSSGTLRYRFYSGFGLAPAEIAKVIAFSALTVACGLLTLGGFALLLQPASVLASLQIPPAIARAAGAACLALVALYVLAAWRLQRPLHLRGHQLKLPGVGLALAQVALGTLNFSLVAATMHQLLAASASYPQVVGGYVLGNIAGLLSHVPGGLGVLEFVMKSIVPGPTIAGALIAFRIIYYIIPLILGLTLLLATEIRRWRLQPTTRRSDVRAGKGR